MAWSGTSWLGLIVPASLLACCLYESHPAQRSLAPLPTAGPGCPWPGHQEASGSGVRSHQHHIQLQRLRKL